MEPLEFVKVSEPTMEMTFCRQRQPVRRQRGKIRNLPPAARAPLQGAAAGCIPARVRRRRRRTASRSPDAARCIFPSSSKHMRREGYELSRQYAARAVSRRSTASFASRSSGWKSTCRANTAVPVMEKLGARQGRACQHESVVARNAHKA